jgi:hypothetical protein
MPSARRAALGLAVLVSALAAASCGGPRGACSQAQPLGSVCGFENPEDVDFSPASKLVLVSQFRALGRGGWLAGLTPGASAPRRLWPLPASRAEPDGSRGDPACTPPDPALFYPHGIFVDAKNDLYVVNHGGRNSIEVFAIRGDGDAATLVWRGCMVLPAGTSGNDVAVAADGSVVVSNYASAVDSLVDNVKIGLGWITGDVLLWRAGSGWSHVPGTAASAANGVALSPDGRTLYYAETGARRFVRIALDGSDRAEVPVPGGPDNLSWTPRGTLYLASHTSTFAFLACLIGPACRSSWVLLEIDPAEMRVDEVLTHDGSLVGAVSSARQVGALVYLGAVFGDRIGVWHTAEDTTGAVWSSLAGLAPDHVLADDAFASLRALLDRRTAAASLNRGAHRS